MAAPLIAVSGLFGVSSTNAASNVAVVERPVQFGRWSVLSEPDQEHGVAPHCTVSQGIVRFVTIAGVPTYLELNRQPTVPADENSTNPDVERLEIDTRSFILETKFDRPARTGEISFDDPRRLTTYRDRGVSRPVLNILWPMRAGRKMRIWLKGRAEPSLIDLRQLSRVWQTCGMTRTPE